MACGRTTGHGMSCTKGWECGECRTIEKQATRIRGMRKSMLEAARLIEKHCDAPDLADELRMWSNI